MSLARDNVELMRTVSKNKLDATVAPTVNDDSGDGYSVGSKWSNTTGGKEYTCNDATVGAAVWIDITGAGGDLSSTNNLSDVDNASTSRTNLGLEIGADVEAYDAANAKTDEEQNYTALQYATSHNYGTVGSTKTISIDDGNNLKMTTTAATPLELTASGFQADASGVMEIINTVGIAVTFPTATFDGNRTQDISAAGTYKIAYSSGSAKMTLGTAILVA